MPLPPALQARLKKRGILQKEESEKETIDTEDATFKCPNAWNPHHMCVEYCRKRWASNKTVTNQPVNYSSVPVPPGWFIVPDPSSGTHYYWNTSTNQVSWLHPLDPNANITAPASVLEKQKENEVQPNRVIPAPPGTEQNQEKEQLLIGRHPSLVKGSQKKHEAAVKRKQSEKESKNEKRSKADLDPMDPASYADVPRGTWSTGLPQVGEAKTGVDTTANGPLFQMRPYPSPGAVLRQNQQISQK